MTHDAPMRSTDSGPDTRGAIQVDNTRAMARLHLNATSERILRGYLGHTL